MPASKAEQVLEGLRAVLETVPNASVDRNSALPERIPDGGLIILRDGDPGEPEEALGGFENAYYQHAVEIEVYVRGRRCRSSRRCLRCSPPADRDGARGGPDPRRPRLRHDLPPPRAGNRGGGGRARHQERDAHRNRRLRERPPLA